MNVRIRFAKYGTVKFIGHLDVMRYFQKAVRRAGLDIVYSQGYHPHQIMSFASPLGVGITSDSEYMDMELSGAFSPEEVTKRLNAAMAQGFAVTGCRVLPEPENGRKRETAMSLITAADYLVSYKDGYDFLLDKEEFYKRFEAFCGQDTIPVVKNVKKSGTQQEMNLKEFLYGIGRDKEELLSNTKEVKPPKTVTEAYETEVVSRAERYENGRTLAMRLSAGSANNVKPELVTEAFCNACGAPYNPFAWQIHRLDLYAGAAPDFESL
ncbi:MAG: DUF2344 domain-containing protein [Lachnospiraceae bacterium]|nr:DUF2344 domain-containing protein [Lachnospiraceae bacterium]